ncbi:MAG TPA: hypothetical protein VNA15_05720 [Candidatus Angelobacter sp.]|nr:hypothetical protein [Candidatus Angelobacter sp.]
MVECSIRQLPHYQTVHPDLIGWYNHFRKILLATGVVVICTIVAANIAWYEILIGVPPLYMFPVFEAWVAIVLVDFQLNFRRFKKSWKAAHPLSAEHLESRVS